ncbi:hypothetical protein [Eubacterium barkeri]|uniref:Uncharacterized protein n=1 Tax=Eubacterium barkeri TaxID=1528 RepID=A0A1H3HGR9_EUBBA|nr:hypothetical protein [Eubacterium barkeri]SDY14018.1 hypothetical protein SAMN04488579_11771 [Eubacterium barkeri]
MAKYNQNGQQNLRIRSSRKHKDAIHDMRRRLDWDDVVPKEFRRSDGKNIVRPVLIRNREKHFVPDGAVGH